MMYSHSGDVKYILRDGRENGFVQRMIFTLRFEVSCYMILSFFDGRLKLI